MKEILIDGETGKFMNLFVDWLGSLEVAKKQNSRLEKSSVHVFQEST